jgi:uncharacterized membrane protein YjjP (DUF1212 family)
VKPDLSLSPDKQRQKTAEPTLPPAELFEYLLEIGGTLMSCGCSTPRLEATLREIAALEGYEAAAFAVPTGLFLSLRGPGLESGMVRLVRVEEWALDLQRLALVDRIFNDVIERRYGLPEARRRLDAVDHSRPAYPRVLRWLATAGAAGASAIFFRGGLGEVLVAFLGGGLLGILFALMPTRLRHLQDFLGGLLAGGISVAATWRFPELSREVLVLSIVILLVPGMALTTALSELSQKNLVAGGARLMDAMMVFLMILFGIAAAIGVEQLVGLKVAPAPARGDTGLLFQVVALVVTAFGFCILFAVPRRFLVTAMISGAIAWIVTGVGARHLPPYLSAFLAAFTVSLYANGVARALNRPAQVFLLPGLVLLVPGSFGFLSLEAFLRGEFLGGAAKGFEMFLIAGAIVTGLLVANAILPARKLL